MVLTLSRFSRFRQAAITAETYFCICSDNVEQFPTQVHLLHSSYSFWRRISSVLFESWFSWSDHGVQNFICDFTHRRLILSCACWRGYGSSTTAARNIKSPSIDLKTAVRNYGKMLRSCTKTTCLSGNRLFLRFTNNPLVTWQFTVQKLDKITMYCDD